MNFHFYHSNQQYVKTEDLGLERWLRGSGTCQRNHENLHLTPKQKLGAAAARAHDLSVPAARWLETWDMQEHMGQPAWHPQQ